MGQKKMAALGAGASGLATETSTWLTAHNGATGVAKVHAIGGTAAVSAAQLTAADAAGTIAGPVATITASPGQLAVTINFSQTVTSTSASLSANYQIMGAATLATVSAVTYTAALNRITLTLSSALKTGDIVRINAGGIKTAAGLSVGLTDVTVGYDLVVPTCTVYAATGTNKIIVTCDELVVQNGTLDTDVDSKVTVGAVAVASTADEAANGSKVVTISRDAGTWSGTGAAIVIQKDLLKDLAGNKVGALTGATVTDTTKPAVVGLPTYTTAGLTYSQGITGAGSNHELLITADAAGVGGNGITVLIVDANQAACIVSVATKAITLGVDLDGAGVCTQIALAALINAHPAASALVTAYAVGGSQNFDTDPGDITLAGGTTRLTVTTTFTEPVTVANVAHLQYNADGADGNERDYATVAGSGTTSVVTTYTLDGTTHQVVPAGNASEMKLTAGIVDRAAVAMTAATPLLSAP
jgi:hypothetical protein